MELRLVHCGPRANDNNLTKVLGARFAGSD